MTPTETRAMLTRRVDRLVEALEQGDPGLESDVDRACAHLIQEVTDVRRAAADRRLRRGEASASDRRLRR